ncbi:hypothetical protein [Ferrovibrio sp.]|uniref:hypothetical protein n=1 Tax=Ferrovibrio sp. TaxID=1917215 RepID=UPI0035B0E559
MNATTPIAMPADLPLPHGLRQLIDCAGSDAAEAILLAHGGTWLNVPKRAAGSALERLVGIDAAAALSHRHGGERLLVPQANQWLAWRGFGRGEANQDIARRLRVDRRTVQRWRGGQTESLGSKLNQLQLL